jgi:hypothetical protein
MKFPVWQKSFYLVVLGLFVFRSLASAEEFGKVTIGNWGFKAGVNERFRYEYRHDFDFNKSSKDNGSLLFNRVIVNAKATLSDGQGKNKIGIFIEGLDAQVGGYQLKPVKNQKDSFDLHQAYLDFYNILDSALDFRIGRQEIKYGAGRLIAAPSWSNRIRSFDAAVLHYHPSELYADIFFGADVKYDDNNFNYIQHKEKIMGIYGGYQKSKDSPKFEFYFLPQRISNTTTKSTRYTAGARLQGEAPGKILYDIELPYQFGKTNQKSIKAYAFHADLSRAFQEVLWEPRLALEYNQASGDKDPNDSVNNTFVPLYQTTHEPYGIMDFFRWENMREISLNVNLSVTNKLKLIPQMNFFWLMSTNDSWYDSTGSALRTDNSGLRSHYVGQEVSLRASYEVNRNIKLESGYAHFFTGGYVKDSGANDDADWVYAQATLHY